MAKITLDQLQIFLAVAQNLHFTRAADALYITQPSVSAAIQSLEKQYGVKLFHRIGRHVELTDAGKMLQQKAEFILADVRAIEQELQQFSDLQQGELKIGASQTIGNYWLPARISQFRRQYPAIQVNCTLGNTQEIGTGVLSGQFDLGLIEGGVHHAQTESLQWEIVGSHRLRIIVGQSHPWFSQSAIPITALTQTTWVMREVGSGTRQWFERVLAEWGIESNQLNVLAEMKSGAMIKAVIETETAAAAISEMMVQKELRLGILKAMVLIGSSDACILDNLMLPLVLIHHYQRFLSPATQAFKKLLMRQNAAARSVSESNTFNKEISGHAETN